MIGFTELIERIGGKHLPIPKRERESTIIRVIHKFQYHNRKYRISEIDREFYLEATKSNSRCFHGVGKAKTLEAVESYFFTCECGESLP